VKRIEIEIEIEIERSEGNDNRKIRKRIEDKKRINMARIRIESKLESKRGTSGIYSLI
jgi:hypothetical protein